MPRCSGTLSILAGCRHTDNKILRPHAALPPAHRKSDAALFGRSQHPRRMLSHGQQNLAPARRPAVCTHRAYRQAADKPDARPYDTAAPVRKPCGSLTGIGRCLRKNSLLFLDYTKKQPEKQLFFKKFRNSTVILRAVEC
jgi:hypothetical protein